MSKWLPCQKLLSVSFTIKTDGYPVSTSTQGLHPAPDLNLELRNSTGNKNSIEQQDSRWWSLFKPESHTGFEATATTIKPPSPHPQTIIVLLSGSGSGGSTGGSDTAAPTVTITFPDNAAAESEKSENIQIAPGDSGDGSPFSSPVTTATLSLAGPGAGPGAGSGSGTGPGREPESPVSNTDFSGAVHHDDLSSSDSDTIYFPEGFVLDPIPADHDLAR